MTTGKKYSKDKLFASISHTAASGVVGLDEYNVHGEVKLSVATDFTTSGTLTVQGRIKNSSSWQSVGTLSSGGDFDTFDIDAYDYVRFNFTVAAGSVGVIAASGFFKAASGGGGLSFTTIQTDTGTNPVAEAASTLTITSSDSSIDVDGNSTTDTVDMTVAPASTDGAVQYNNAGALGGDAAELFWDDTNDRLGLGTATPLTALHVVGDNSNANGIRLYSSAGVLRHYFTDYGASSTTTASLFQGGGTNITYGGAYMQCHHKLADSYYRFRYVGSQGFEWKTGANKDSIEIMSNGDLHIKQGLTKSLDSISGATTLDDTHHTVIGDATSAAFTVTLPAATSNSGRVYVIKKIDSSANVVTVDGNASETIDGATTHALSSQYDFVRIQCDGSNWHII